MQGGGAGMASQSTGDDLAQLLTGPNCTVPVVVWKRAANLTIVLHITGQYGEFQEPIF